ncbi:hypothetical protein [Hyphomicrobium sp. D-2]|uniref:hypothetical protein n=1 Tax=Hyphomicrobium sp. D-2 TaxID=3041621 RepID=UPI00245647C1|nr:hypothetical protein [Hyphomicrobium sp. D-2]MDH4982614.1 hypothetical protein [Hyphomicrobium sp. D-2]
MAQTRIDAYANLRELPQEIYDDQHADTEAAAQAAAGSASLPERQASSKAISPTFHQIFVMATDIIAVRSRASG